MDLSQYKPAEGRPLKVLVLGFRGPGCEGGIERHVEELTSQLAHSATEISLIGRSPYRNERLQPKPNVQVKWLWAPRAHWLETPVHSFVGLAYAIVQRPDVLYVHAVGPALVTPLARLFGLPVVVTHHGFDFNRERWGLFARTILKLGEAFGMRFANERIVISREIQEHVSLRYGKAVWLIPNGVRLPDRVAGSEVIEKLGLTRGRYVVQVSRCVPEKRQSDLVAAFAKVNPPGWKLVLVGTLKDGDAYCETLRDIASRTPGVLLAGFRSGDELHQLYANAGLFVLPSSHEGLPIALLEALSYGLPALVSDIPSNLEVGLPSEQYFPLGDVDALASKIAARIACPEDGLRAEERRDFVASRYDWQSIAQRTLAVLQRAAGRHSA